MFFFMQSMLDRYVLLFNDANILQKVIFCKLFKQIGILFQ